MTLSEPKLVSGELSILMLKFDSLTYSSLTCRGFIREASLCTPCLHRVIDDDYANGLSLAAIARRVSVHWRIQA